MDCGGSTLKLSRNAARCRSEIIHFAWIRQNFAQSFRRFRGSTTNTTTTNSIIPLPTFGCDEDTRIRKRGPPATIWGGWRKNWIERTRDRPGEYRYALDDARYTAYVDRNGLLESSLNDVTSAAAGTSSHAARTNVTCHRRRGCIYMQTTVPFSTRVG